MSLSLTPRRSLDFGTNTSKIGVVPRDMEMNCDFGVGYPKPRFSHVTPGLLKTKVLDTYLVLSVTTTVIL